MKKKFRFLALAMLAVASLSAIGCGKGSSSSGDGDSGNTPPEDMNGTYENNIGDNFESVYGPLEGTIHERSISATTNKILDNGVTSYKLLLPTEAGEQTMLAASEFNTFFSESTSVRLPVLQDDSIAYSDSATYISLGNTTFLQQSGITVDYSTLEWQGYEIVTKGNSIFIAAEDLGVLYGVYDLLNCLVEFETFSANYYHLAKNVKDIPLYNFDIKEKPDIPYRQTSYGNVLKVKMAQHRMRMTLETEYFVEGANTHKIFNFVPKELAAEHPNWFMPSMKQICYTAGEYGSSEYEALIDCVVEKAKVLLTNDQKHNVLSISQDDYNVWCDCVGCKAVIEKYGVKAATQILFINDVAERVEEWVNVAFPGRKVMLDILAYNQSSIAPTTLQSDGTYKLNHEDMKLRDNVQIMVAPIDNDYNTPIFDEKNLVLKNYFLAWEPVASCYSVWTYDCYWYNYMAPMDSWSNMSDIAKFLVKLNTQWWWPQGAWSQTQNTNFDLLKNYIYSKLMWNANSDVSALINNYFDKVYRDASDTMKQAYWNMRAELRRHTVLGLDGNTWQQPLTTTKYYTKQYLVAQIAQIEKAYADIEKYKVSDPAYYETICGEIAREACGPRFMLFAIYEGTFANSERQEFVTSLYKDLIELGFDRVEDYTTIDDYFAGKL
ncbi:MAG: DUF4838 domain-containing protein [Clostridia bacterium]|nr:DUF4838 domain-containing protein [Clostridia bacterium]